MNSGVEDVWLFKESLEDPTCSLSSSVATFPHLEMGLGWQIEALLWGMTRRDLVCVWLLLRALELPATLWFAFRLLLRALSCRPESATSFTSSGSMNASLKARCLAEGICEPVTRLHILVELSICPILSYKHSAQNIEPLWTSFSSQTENVTLCSELFI